jgi:hypothetical protein
VPRLGQKACGAGDDKANHLGNGNTRFDAMVDRVSITGRYEEGESVSTALIIILVALVLGGVGLAVEAFRWLLIVALILIVIGALTGRRTVP